MCHPYGSSSRPHLWHSQATFSLLQASFFAPRTLSTAPAHVSSARPLSQIAATLYSWRQQSVTLWPPPWLSILLFSQLHTSSTVTLFSTLSRPMLTFIGECLILTSGQDLVLQIVALFHAWAKRLGLLWPSWLVHALWRPILLLLSIFQFPSYLRYVHALTFAF